MTAPTQPTSSSAPNSSSKAPPGPSRTGGVSGAAIVSDPPVVLPSTLTVRVDQEDIVLGIRGDSYECPIARALRRTLVLLGYRPVSVGVGLSRSGYATVTVITETHPSGGGMVMYRCDDADGWITRFDKALPVEPRSFELVPLDSVDQPIPFSLTGKQP